MTVKADWVDKDTPGKSAADWTFDAAAANIVATQVNTNTSNIAAKYTKPGGGIPSSDMTAAVQASLARADAEGISVKGSGAVGDGSANDRAAFAAADTAAQSAGTAVLIDAGTYRISTNLSITSPVVFQPGASIKPDSAVTVTLAGGLTAPNGQLFDHSVGGMVIPKNVDFYRPQWWGDTGTADDSQAWLDMADAMDASLFTLGASDWGQRVLVPQGPSRIVGVTLSNCEIIADKNTSFICPPNGTTTGIVLTLGGYASLRGGYYGFTEATMAVTSIFMQGARSRIDNVVVETWPAGSVGIQVSDTSNSIPTSPLLSDVHVQGQATPAAGSIGIDLQTSDAIMTNIRSAMCDIGLKMQRGSAHITNLHVWGNNTGIAGTGFDACQFSNVYLDSNLGWGIDVDQMKSTVWDGIYAWRNGGTIGSTGAIRLRETAGAAFDNVMRGVVLSGNTGHGILIDGSENCDIEAILSYDSGGPTTAVGVEVTSATAGLRLAVHGEYATTPLINAGVNTVIATPTGMLAPCRVTVRGTETFTIVGGNVTQIAGTTIDDVAVDIGDRVLIHAAPASTGAGSFGSTQPGNGIYEVTGNTTNISVRRARDMLGNPAGLSVFVAGGAWYTGTGWTVLTPYNPRGGFTYGSGNINLYMTFRPDPVTISNTQTLYAKTLSSVKLESGHAPASATAAGTAGQIEWDSGYIYLCTVTGGAGAATWLRAAVTTWT